MQKERKLSSISRSNLRTCQNGHKYHKTSDCPVCPICEKKKKPGAEFLKRITAPARRALEREKINTLLKLSTYTKADLLKLHGIGPASIPTLQKAMEERGLSFKT